jgi:hypothetical protein
VRQRLFQQRDGVLHREDAAQRVRAQHYGHLIGDVAMK